MKVLKNSLTGRFIFTPIKIENPVKELFEYGEAVRKGREIRKKLENNK